MHREAAHDGPRSGPESGYGGAIAKPWRSGRLETSIAKNQGRALKPYLAIPSLAISRRMDGSWATSAAPNS